MLLVLLLTSFLKIFSLLRIVPGYSALNASFPGLIANSKTPDIAVK